MDQGYLPFIDPDLTNLYQDSDYADLATEVESSLIGSTFTGSIRDKDTNLEVLAFTVTKDVGALEVLWSLTKTQIATLELIKYDLAYQMLTAAGKLYTIYQTEVFVQKYAGSKNN